MGDDVTQIGQRISQMDTSKQYSFRLPEKLVQRVDQCAEEMRTSGLDVTRADVVRLLLKHALNATNGELRLILRPQSATSSPERARF